MSTNLDQGPLNGLFLPPYYVGKLPDSYADEASDVLRAAVSSWDARSYRMNADNYESFGAISPRGALIGMAAMHYKYLDDVVEVELKHLATLPEFQKQRALRVGTNLIHVVENHAMIRGADKITLTSYPTSWHFYDKKGYKTIDGSDLSMKFEKTLINFHNN